MQPTDPTQTQLNARLNPTPATLNIPAGQQLYRQTGDFGSAIYLSGPNGYQNFNLLDPANGLVTQDQINKSSSYGAASGIALGNLKSQYGVDFNSLPEFNNADYNTELMKSGKGFIDAEGSYHVPQMGTFDLKQYATATGGGSTSQTVNNTPNSLAPGVTQTTAPAPVMSNANPAAVAAQTGATATPTQGGYAGPSVVDYLKSVNQASDFGSRAALAKQYGITNYSGTAAQNTQLLNTLRQQNPAGGSADGAPATAPTGKVGESGTMGTASAGATGAGGTASGAPADKYAGLDPIQKQVQMYQDAYKALGLNTIKDQFDSYTKQQTDLTNKMNDEIAGVRNNPWLSQSVQDRTVTQVQSKYATKLDTLTHLLTLTDSLYKTGQAQVDHMVSDANADIKATNDLAQKQLDAATALAKDNEVVSTGGRELLVNKQTGKTVADLGPSNKASQATSLADKEAFYLFQQQNKSTGSTQAEQKQSVIDAYSNAFAPGVKMANGIPTLDSSGQITPEAWKAAIAEAPGKGITRTDFIKNFGPNVVAPDGTVSKNYGMTPAEIKSLGATAR